jgi:hypothetical protein
MNGFDVTILAGQAAPVGALKILTQRVVGELADRAGDETVGFGDFLGFVQRQPPAADADVLDELAASSAGGVGWIGSVQSAPDADQLP